MTRPSTEMPSQAWQPAATPEIEPAYPASDVHDDPASTAMHLEIPRDYGDDAPPVPPAQTAALYEDVENAIEGSFKDTPAGEDAPPVPPAQVAAIYEDIDNIVKTTIRNAPASPVPPAQVAAMYEDMDNAIKGSLTDYAPPLQDSQIAQSYEDTENEKKAMRKKPETIDQREPDMPLIPSS